MSQNNINYNLSIEKNIISVQNALKKQIKQLDNIKLLLNNNQDFLIDNILQKSISEIEKSVFSLRNIYSFTSNISHSDNVNDKHNFNNTHNCNISIQKKQYGYHLSLPITLPKYGEKSKSLLSENLMSELKIFNQNNQLNKFEKAVFVFINNISNNVSTNKVRDNDNYEYKDIINVLAFWFLPDDSFKCCNIYNGTKISDKNSTEIFIVPTDKFADFYIKNQNLLS